jgi:endonuclease
MDEDSPTVVIRRSCINLVRFSQPHRSKVHGWPSGVLIPSFLYTSTLHLSRMKPLDDLRMSLDFAIQKGESFVCSCRCQVLYQGRVESFLPEGDRIIILKRDGCLIIHQPEGNNPANSMRPGTCHEIIRAEGILIWKARNLPNSEFIDITITKAYFFDSHPLEDGMSLQLSGSERDMADMIMKRPGLISPYFKPLSREEHTECGFVDVLGYEGKVLTIVECRRVQGDPKAVDQLRRYVEAIKKTKGVEKVQGVLACPDISDRAMSMLADFGFGFVRMKPPSYLERCKKQSTLDGF